MILAHAPVEGRYLLFALDDPLRPGTDLELTINSGSGWIGHAASAWPNHLRGVGRDRARRGWSGGGVLRGLQRSVVNPHPAISGAGAVELARIPATAR